MTSERIKEKVNSFKTWIESKIKQPFPPLWDFDQAILDDSIKTIGDEKFIDTHTLEEYHQQILERWTSNSMQVLKLPLSGEATIFGHKLPPTLSRIDLLNEILELRRRCAE